MTVKHILFPVDFSDYSRAMNPEVEWLAEHLGSHVTLLHVFDMPRFWYGGFEPSLMMAGEDYVSASNTVRQHLDDYQLAIPADRLQRVLVDGDPAWEIAKYAREHQVDLVVMGTHGFGPIRRLLLGSVAMKVLHDVECPVWTRPSLSDAKLNPALGISRIVCSLNLTEEAVPLLKYAKEVAALFSATVDVVHCVPETSSRPAKYFDYDFNRTVLEMTRQGIQEIQQEAATDFPVHVTNCAVAQDITTIANQQDADLVIIGRGKAQNILGTVRTHAYDIICQAPCPVLSFSMEHDSAQPSTDNSTKTNDRVLV